jgi:hypothetical protein
MEKYYHGWQGMDREESVLVLSVLVLGAWCLVLGAWCLVLGAWCLVRAVSENFFYIFSP